MIQRGVGSLGWRAQWCCFIKVRKGLKENKDPRKTGDRDSSIQRRNSRPKSPEGRSEVEEEMRGQCGKSLTGEQIWGVGSRRVL